MRLCTLRQPTTVIFKSIFDMIAGVADKIHSFSGSVEKEPPDEFGNLHSGASIPR